MTDQRTTLPTTINDARLASFMLLYEVEFESYLFSEVLLHNYDQASLQAHYQHVSTLLVNGRISEVGLTPAIKRVCLRLGMGRADYEKINRYVRGMDISD